MGGWPGNPADEYPGRWSDATLERRAGEAERYVHHNGMDADGRRSLAKLYLDGCTRSRGDVSGTHPWLVTFLEAAGLPVSSDQDPAAADRWALALDHAGANDRLRAFFDRTERVEQAPGFALTGYDPRAVICLLATDELLLEPVADRLLPGRLDEVGEVDPSAYGARSRGVPTTDRRQVVIPDPEGHSHGGPLEAAVEQMCEVTGLGPEVSFGELFDATHGENAFDDAFDEIYVALERLDRAKAFATRAMTGLMITTTNQHLIGSHDVVRWKDLAARFDLALAMLERATAEGRLDDECDETFMEGLGELGELAADLVASHEPGAVEAYDQLVRNVGEITGWPEVKVGEWLAANVYTAAIAVTLGRDQAPPLADTPVGFVEHAVGTVELFEVDPGIVELLADPRFVASSIDGDAVVARRLGSSRDVVVYYGLARMLLQR